MNKMSEITQNIRQILAILVPASIIHDIACFKFYDNHPRDDKKHIDITICTKSGEVREYYRRSVISSIRVEDIPSPSEINILRNSGCELFYLLLAGDDLIILSRREKLKIHQRVSNIERFEVNDATCSGQGCLKIVRKDDAVPLIFDDNFENFQAPEMSETYTGYLEDDCLPIVTHLKMKLTEAKYSVKCNEKSYKEFMDLRQMAAFSMYKKIHQNLDDSVIKGGSRKMAGALNLKFQTPWVKVCNKKIIIAFIACNENIDPTHEESESKYFYSCKPLQYFTYESSKSLQRLMKKSGQETPLLLFLKRCLHLPLQDVHILLHGTTTPSLVYNTKLFQKIKTPPFWTESHTQTISHDIETAVTVVMDLKEIKHNITSKIELSGVLFYTKAGKECLLPIEYVRMSAMDTMGKEFDVLSSNKTDNNTMLALLAATEKTDVILRHIKRNDDQDMLGMDMFCRYLDMALVPGADIVIHRSSPYHMLHGVMIIKLNEEESPGYCLKVSVHSRSPSQVLALIHYIHDAIPLNIIATTSNYNTTAKDQMTDHSVETDQSPQSYKLLDYAQSIVDRNATILEYLDSSMVKMNESKNPSVQSKIGTEIDLLAGGMAKFTEFRGHMLDKASEGVQMVLAETSCVIATDTMVTE